MLKTIKTTFISSIVLVATLAALLYIVPKVTTKNRDDMSNVEVTVMFTPTIRTGKPVRPGGQVTDVVTIIVSVSSDVGGPARVTPDKAKESPWHRFYYLAPGTKMVVSAGQFTGDTITCQIAYRGKAQPPRTAMGPAGVTCTFRAPA